MTLENSGLRKRLADFFNTDKPLYILLVLVLAERLYIAWTRDAGQIIVINDSVNYLEAGLEFAATGRLTYLGSVTALIMPGITLLTGGLARLFQGDLLMRAIQLVWILLGSLTPIFLYKTIDLFVPKIWALLTAAVYLLPTHVMIDNYLLTEGPYYLFFVMALYYTFKLGQDGRLRFAFRYGLAVCGGLLFRANCMMLLPFTALYLLLLRKYSFRELLKKAAAVCCMLALFIVPWTVRNYLRFDAFIPLSYGTYNPILDGTGFLDGYPVKGLDYIEPQERFKADHAAYFDEDWQMKDPEQRDYLQNLYIKYLVEYRLKEWFKRDPAGFLKTYLIQRPRIALNWSWYWETFPGVTYEMMHFLRQINCVFCIWTVLLSLARKRYRKQILFLSFCYVVNLYMIAFALPIDRYAQMAMPYRYLIAGLGMAMSWEWLRGLWKKLSPGGPA